VVVALQQDVWVEELATEADRLEGGLEASTILRQLLSVEVNLLPVLSTGFMRLLEHLVDPRVDATDDCDSLEDLAEELLARLLSFDQFPVGVMTLLALRHGVWPGKDLIVE